MKEVSIRKITEADIENKIKWINNPNNNAYLHYNLPLEYEKTLIWYHQIKDNPSRYDAVILYNDIPVGVIGLINIDELKRKAEYYITLGEESYKRKGISYEASKQLINYGFYNYQIEKIWLCVDDENIGAKKLYEKLGFQKEGLLHKDIYFKGHMIDRAMYGITKEEWYKNEYSNN